MRLHPNAHVAVVGDDLVLLDVAKDEYFCLPTAASLLAFGEDGETVQRCDDALLEQLVTEGLVMDASAPCPPGARAPLRSPGTMDLGADPEMRLRPVDIWRMAQAALRLYCHGPRGTLASMIEVARTARPPPAGARAEDPFDLARRFEHLLPWIPFQGECLFRSFLTVTALRRAGVNVSWVFGVQTWPFRAHCWLQIDDVVLNDAAERVSGYVPIMVT